MSTFEAIIAIAAMSAVSALWLLGRVVERASTMVADNLRAQNAELHRIGTKLDNLWSPITGINTVLWKQPGISSDMD